MKKREVYVSNDGKWHATLKEAVQHDIEVEILKTFPKSPFPYEMHQHS